jgi:hypothetical protein
MNVIFIFQINKHKITYPFNTFLKLGKIKAIYKANRISSVILGQFHIKSIFCLCLDIVYINLNYLKYLRY